MRWASLLVAMSACVPGPQTDVALAPASFAMFEAKVHPVLERRCANPTCHGDPARPLELYGTQQHRLDPLRLHLDEPVSQEELQLDFQRSRAFFDEDGDPSRCHLLTKPLAESAGGSKHSGGAQFEDAHEEEYQTLLEWVTRASVAAR